MSENMKKFLTALAILSVALFSMFFTIYNYIKYPENRKVFIERLKNARKLNIFREIREMQMERRRK